MEKKDNEMRLTGLSLYGELKSIVLVIQNKVDNLKERFDEFKLEVDDFVSDKEFEPVRNIVYGFVGLILLTVAGSLIALVIKQ